MIMEHAIIGATLGIVIYTGGRYLYTHEKEAFHDIMRRAIFSYIIVLLMLIVGDK